MNNKKGQWIKYVSDCFRLGYDLLKKYDKINLSKLLELDNEKISEIFLHSLMFEDKFIDKMNRTFEQIL